MTFFDAVQFLWMRRKRKLKKSRSSLAQIRLLNENFSECSNIETKNKICPAKIGANYKY